MGPLPSLHCLLTSALLEQVDSTKFFVLTTTDDQAKGRLALKKLNKTMLEKVYFVDTSLYDSAVQQKQGRRKKTIRPKPQLYTSYI